MNYIQYVNTLKHNRMRKMAKADKVDYSAYEDYDPTTEAARDTSWGTAFKPGWTNTATGLLGTLVGSYVGNRYAGTPGLIAGGIGGGALGYSGGSLATNLVERIKQRGINNRQDAHAMAEYIARDGMGSGDPNASMYDNLQNDPNVSYDETPVGYRARQALEAIELVEQGRLNPAELEQFGISWDEARRGGSNLKKSLMSIIAREKKVLDHALSPQ